MGVSRSAGPGDAGRPAVLGRRSFLRTTAGGLAAAIGAGAYVWRVEPRWLEMVYRPLPLRRLSSALVGRTLVLVSDVHVGARVDDDYLVASFRRLERLQPDIVVLTGDFMSYDAEVFDRLPAVYRHFPRGRRATLAVLGNHDYGPGWRHPEIAQRLVEAVQPFGITVLRNQIHEVDGLQIAGLDDLWARAFDAAPVVSRLDASRGAIALSHNPDTVDLPVWGEFDGWILSGHTHGGQCKPPFLPPPILPVKNRRYTAGEFRVSDNRRLYISRGVGHLVPIRFNVRPEVTVFELQSS